MRLVFVLSPNKKVNRFTSQNLIPNPQSVWGPEAEKRKIKEEIKYLNVLLKARNKQPYGKKKK